MNPYKILVIDCLRETPTSKSFYLDKKNGGLDIISSTEEAITKDISQYNLLLIGEISGTVSGIDVERELFKKSDIAGVPVVSFTANQLQKMYPDCTDVSAEQYMGLWRQIGFDL